MNEKVIKDFKNKFQKRMKNIAKTLNPSGYAITEAYGYDDPDGPQIFGEMVEWLRKI